MTCATTPLPNLSLGILLVNYIYFGLCLVTGDNDNCITAFSEAIFYIPPLIRTENICKKVEGHFGSF